MSKQFSYYPSEVVSNLEFDKIVELIRQNCLSDLGKNSLDQQQFSTIPDEINYKLRQVFEMKNALANGLKFPAQNYFNLSEYLDALKIENNIIEGIAFRKILLVATTINDFGLFFEKNKEYFTVLPQLFEMIAIDKNIPILIDEIIDENGIVRSDASPTLVKIRKQIVQKTKSIQVVFGRILQQLKEQNKLSDTEESIRNGRRVLAIQAENKRNVNGIIHDESDSGKTSYIEPQETVFLNNELFELERDEKREIYKILKDLSHQIADKIPILEQYQEVLANYDLIRAKAKLALLMDANMPVLSAKEEIKLIEAYHPLLYLKNKSLKKETIPFAVSLDKQQSILIISGPNAGGKSVTLKTIGLMQLMLQFGLLIPCDENSKCTVFTQVFTDVGDKQSIEDELSTYSSHLNLMHHFIHHGNAKTLFLVDEFGSGTDPRLGAAMAENLLLYLAETKAFGVVTTHYTNLKKIAEQHERMLNAAMVFNEKDLSPTYHLQTGKPGSSYTFAIAKKSGFSQSFIEEAQEKVDYSDLKFEELIQKVENERKKLTQENKAIRSENKKLKELIAKFEKSHQQLEEQQIAFRKQLLTLEKDKQGAIEQKVNQVLNDINNAKSKEIAAQKAKELNAIRKELIGQKERIIPKPKQVSTDFFAVGDSVLIDNTDAEGEIIEIRGKKAIVAIKGLKTTIPFSRLQKVQKKEYKTYKKRKTIPLDIEVETVFDIRGLMQDEARPIIEQYFDQALYNNLDAIKIIHGKGTGALRRQLLQLIKEYNQNILEWKYEEEKKGGNGATIIYFK